MYLIPGFYLAMEMGDAELVLHLLATHKVPPDRGVRWNEWSVPETPCALAAALKMENVMRALLAAGHRGVKHRSSVPLVSAGYSGCVGCAQMLLEAGVDVNEREGSNDEGDSGMTALMAAAEQKHLEVFELLLKAGADPNLLTKRGVCAASLGAEGGERSAEFISLLIAHGCKEFGRAVVLPAAQGDAKVLRAMIEAGAQVNVVATKYEGIYEGKGSLECALSHLSTLKICANACNENYEEGRVKRAELIARIPDAYEVIEMLVEAGVDLNRMNGMRTPLHLAVNHKELRVVKLFLAKGADPNSIANWFAAKRTATEAERYYSTAVHEAVFQKHAEILAELIRAGAEVNRKDREGRTPLALALENSFKEGVELLRQAGGEG
ncbi:MAG TPA: ankyrin repeat domain-containing protein [Verrucomicrobiae bacterium]